MRRTISAVPREEGVLALAVGAHADGLPPSLLAKVAGPSIATTAVPSLDRPEIFHANTLELQNVHRDRLGEDDAPLRYSTIFPDYASEDPGIERPMVDSIAALCKSDRRVPASTASTDGVRGGDTTRTAQFENFKLDYNPRLQLGNSNDVGGVKTHLYRPSACQDTRSRSGRGAGFISEERRGGVPLADSSIPRSALNPCRRIRRCCPPNSLCPRP